ncbi:hypothetical protein H072_4439 [Dactylellina haptotyla CBS 200.50]|uniref:Uncharacterized protein n=1 Tax=Dactylellina haptotyla (strain CBS 200.50) TaxID=1284197 RepID=S8AKJ2_DACHA|nr:hypothetical protein H072_4439 [Dactylellina haptotyla CBS 200.50]
MVRIWNGVLLAVSVLGLLSFPGISANLITDIVDFQDLQLSLGQALDLTSYAGFLWQGIKAFRPSGLSLGSLFGGSGSPFAIISGVDPTKGALTGMITSTSGPISLQGIQLKCCQSTDPTKCDQQIPCTVTVTGKDDKGAELVKKSFNVAPAAGLGIPGLDSVINVVTGLADAFNGVPSLEGIITVVFDIIPIAGLGRHEVEEHLDERGVKFTAQFFKLVFNKKFQNLILPDSKSSVVLDELGGVTFHNINVTHITHHAGGGSDEIPSIAAIGGNFGPDRDKSTVAILDTKSTQGAKITTPFGKRLKSIEFFCCSNAKGESILEGNPCKQTKCKIIASSFHKNGTRLIRQNEGVGISAPAKVLVGTTPSVVTSTTLPVTGFVVSGVTTVARSLVIDFARARTGVAASRRRKLAHVHGAVKGGATDILVITNLVMESVEEN